MARPRRIRPPRSTVAAIPMLPPTIEQRAEARALAEAMGEWLAMNERADVEYVRRHVETVNVGNPPAGDDAVYQVSGEAIMRPLAVLCTLTADATGAGRQVYVELRDQAGGVFALAGSSAEVSPATSQRFSFWPGAGYPTWPVSDAAVAAMPDGALDSWEYLAICVSGAGPADQLSGIRVRGEFEWQTPPLLRVEGDVQ